MTQNPNDGFRTPRRWQFSLKTLTLLTIVSGVAGTAVYHFLHPPGRAGRFDSPS